MTRTGQQTRLTLSESHESQTVTSDWVEPIVTLGAELARYHRTPVHQQVIVAVSVPSREYAAALIGCGWNLASRAPDLRPPIDSLRALEPGQPIRIVNSRDIITGCFTFLDESTNPPHVQFAGSKWRVDGIKAMSQLDGIETPQRERKPDPTALEQLAGHHRNWDDRLAKPAADLAIIGTSKWICEDLDAGLVDIEGALGHNSIRAILKPKLARSATWSTRVFSSAALDDCSSLPQDLNAVILDGNGAVKFLGEITAPVVVCVLDRSVAEESAAELVIQIRNSRGEPLSPKRELAWSPPAGVEALAFTVAL